MIQNDSSKELVICHTKKRRRVNNYTSPPLPEVPFFREAGKAMRNEQWNKTNNREPRLSLEKAEEILRNVYQEVGKRR